MAGRASRGVSGKTRNYQSTRTGEDARRANTAGQRTRRNSNNLRAEKDYNLAKSTSFEDARRWNSYRGPVI